MDTPIVYSNRITPFTFVLCLVLCFLYSAVSTFWFEKNPTSENFLFFYPLNLYLFTKSPFFFSSVSVEEKIQIIQSTFQIQVKKRAEGDSSAYFIRLTRITAPNNNAEINYGLEWWKK